MSPLGSFGDGCVARVLKVIARVSAIIVDGRARSLKICAAPDVFRLDI
jgi:hypothetical protein